MELKPISQRPSHTSVRFDTLEEQQAFASNAPFFSAARWRRPLGGLAWNLQSFRLISMPSSLFQRGGFPDFIDSSERVLNHVTQRLAEKADPANTEFTISEANVLAAINAHAQERRIAG
jgi:hypothetical protein